MHTLVFVNPDVERIYEPVMVMNIVPRRVIGKLVGQYFPDFQRLCRSGYCFHCF